nr:DegT/DnrJ/EryC1/StrS family aminotransferase [uncultured Psychroserpens sp.]
MINVTKTFLPPQEEYQKILKRAWQTSWITNRGVLVKELEAKLKTKLGVENLTLTTNGTIPIQIAIKGLKLKGEIITTPFSYVATTSSILWEGCEPVFVDIDPDYLTIDEQKIEEAITSNTCAILATHVFGNPCHVEEIERIAEKHHLKVIYDAAHCFGVDYKGQSILNYGDVSTLSFHATKIFHTGEGGAFVAKSTKLHTDLFYHHNFGHNGPDIFVGIGINAKMSELQAAMGLALFPYIDEIFESRKSIVNYYDLLLNHLKVKFLKIREGTKWNYCYYPLIFESEKQLLKVEYALAQNEIYPRRYFYPSLNTLDYVKGKEMPISESISKRILCLPLYHGLKRKEIEIIVKIIENNI